MPEHHGGDMGGTMRLGKRKTVFKTADSILRQLYGNADTVEERHRHRYEVNPKYVPEFEAAGLKFVGQDVAGERMEMVELAGHPFYCAVQYHPEYISRPLTPSPPYLGLILASAGKLNSFLSHGMDTVANSRAVSDDGESSDDEISSLVKNLSYSDHMSNLTHFSPRASGGLKESPSASSVEGDSRPGSGGHKKK